MQALSIKTFSLYPFRFLSVDQQEELQNYSIRLVEATELLLNYRQQNPVPQHNHVSGLCRKLL